MICEFGTSCTGISTVSYEGKTYNTVQIGTQCCLKENLDVGATIGGSATQTNNSAIEKYCYNDDPANCATYGGLYQWNEAMQYSVSEASQGICPIGWHIPTYAEFRTLKTSVNYDGNALKAVGQGTGGGAGTNTSGFSALQSGGDDGGSFFNIGTSTYFWNSTVYDTAYADIITLTLIYSDIGFNYSLHFYGFSVRCLEN